MEFLNLHGHTVEAALNKLNSQIDWLLSKEGDILIINHGKGHHSEHGVGVIKHRVRVVLKEKSKEFKQQGYMVVYGESDYPVALEYDGGCTIIVKKGLENQYLGGNKRVERNKIIYSEEGRLLRKQQKRQRHNKK